MSKREPFSTLPEAPNSKRIWTSLEEKKDPTQATEDAKKEFLTPISLGRRGFLGLGASVAALASEACIRRPVEHIYPYTKAPEFTIPGISQHFATILSRRGESVGVLVECHEGRPTKIEGNEEHPTSLGSADMLLQSATMDLYDADRSEYVREKGKRSDWGAFDKAFADRCLAAARKSYAFLLTNPADHRADLAGFSTGPYQTNDATRRLWAAAELWETTGEADSLKDFEARAKGVDHKLDATAGWGNVKNLAMYTYALSKRDGRDPALLEAVRSAIVSTADEIVKTAGTHGYARPLGTRYYWGCNGDVAQQAQTLHVANVLKPNRAYVDASLDALGHLFGRNVFGRSFVTGLGHHPPLHPHDRRSGADKVDAPWPGYLVGGGWPKATDWQDIQESYRTNEIAINWNATLVYALAGFVSSDVAEH